MLPFMVYSESISPDRGSGPVRVEVAWEISLNIIMLIVLWCRDRIRSARRCKSLLAETRIDPRTQRDGAPDGAVVLVKLYGLNNERSMWSSCCFTILNLMHAWVTQRQ